MALAAPPNEASPRRHQNRRRNHNMDRQGAVDPLKVYVSGFPPYTKEVDLKTTFESYGNVSIQMMKHSAIVTLPNAEKTKEAIANSRKFILYGEFVTVKPFNGQVAVKKARKRVFVRSKEKNVIIEPSKIDLSGNFTQQLDNLLAAVKLTQDEVNGISQLYEDLESAIKKIWPDCEANPFGSITTGLAIKTSDADCFMYVPPQYKIANTNYVNRAKRILYNYPKIFTEILSIPNAHTPLVKFFHIPTETNCDVSFKTFLGKKNSELIAFLLHSDPRLIPVAVVIKYWAKVHGISGTGKLSNYALMMLFIFFLQQPHVSILPSVESLQRDSTKECIIDAWNAGIEQDMPNSTQNKSPISELLGGFFEYYASFKLEEDVVCPFLGRAIKKADFADLATLPAEMSRYTHNVENEIVLPIKHMTAMCVQDPIELCHNVASSMSGRLLAELKEYMKFAAAAYVQGKESECSSFLKRILLEKPPSVKNSRTEFKVKIQARNLQQLGEEWRNVVRQVLTVMFEQICLAKLEPATPHLIDHFTTEIIHPVWKRKKFAKVHSRISGSFLEKQINITKDILNVNKEKHNLQMSLVVDYGDGTKTALATLKYLDGDKPAFSEFGKFFILMIKDWFYILLKPYLKSAPGANGSEDSIEVNLANGDESGDCDRNEPGEADSDVECEASVAE